MTDVRAERCEELRQAITAMLPVLVESQGNAARLVDVRRQLAVIRSVADRGEAGIDDPAFLRWLAVAPRNLDAFDDAIDKGDAAAAWTAFQDQQSGLNLLATGCAGCSGW